MINDQVIEEIKTHLKDYLEEKGLNTKKLFNCLKKRSYIVLVVIVTMI